MGRKKSVAKKPADTVQPRQGSGTLKFTASDHQERYQWFSQQRIFRPFVINMDVAKHFGLQHEVAEMLVLPEWRALLVDFRDTIHADLLLEVMTTLQVPGNFDLASTKCISFTVGRIKFHFSADDLSRLMDLDEVQALSEQEMGQRWMDVPDDQVFWEELTDGKTSFRSSYSRSTQFKNRGHKFIQHILSRSVCGRFDSGGTVTHADLLCLYGMVKRFRIHMGVVIGSLFINQHPTKVRTLFLGPYVTRIVRNSQRFIINEPSLGNVQEVTVALINKIFPTKKSDKRARVEGGDEEEENEEEAGDEVPVEGEVGEGSSRLNFQQQVLAQLGAMQLQMGQIYQQVGQVHTEVQNLNTRVDNLEGAVGRLETRDEATAYQAWLRSQFPPPGGPHYPFDPSAGPSF